MGGPSAGALRAAAHCPLTARSLTHWVGPAHEVSALCSCTLGQARDLLEEHEHSVEASVNAYYTATDGGKQAMEFEDMSVKELRHHIEGHGVSLSGLLEKCDLVSRARDCAGGKTYVSPKHCDAAPA